ncbi:MAG: nicotinamide-nucleotide amidohydrolase family protein [Woeseiaceae bacterium]|nr:nicotinamide-nucleotide amidohydrolase family protein [Woeseiaceae bacterium]
MADKEALYTLSSTLVTALASAGKTVTTAESCTGGWLAKAITDIPGSSAVFAYGLVSYSNGAKESLLGVDAGTLQEHGAVSADVVLQMANGALRVSAADIAVAVSGVAGPSGGSEEKPVGTVWFAWAVKGRLGVKTDTQCMHFSGDRDTVRRQTVMRALHGLIERSK